MPRSIPEWIGKTDDSQAPPHVRLRNFRDHDGICHICGQKIWPGQEWQSDHVDELEDGGENREDNLAPAHERCHNGPGGKTSQARTRREKADRIAKKHLGIHQSGGRPMAGNRNSPWKAKIGGGWERRDGN